MGALFYSLSAAYRASVDECAAIHAERFGHSQPLHYLLGTEGAYEDTVWEVQPALMFHMTGLAAMWRAAGVEPAATIGHSQGELAAGAVSGVMTVRDAVLAVTHRSRLVERISPRGYSMAVLGMDREACEALLARNSGWAELSVVNSPHILAISGDRQTILDLVAAATERGQFAREIRVAYPAHTSIVAELREEFEGLLGDEMSGPRFADSEIACYGATLGAAITADLTHEEYWYWNLRNRVRFDKAVVAAGRDGVDLLIEVAEHPVLQLALQENLGLVPAGSVRDPRVLGTSLRTATGLEEFTRNLAQVAVLHSEFNWSALQVSDAVALPLRDFPHTIMSPKHLWAPLDRQPSPPELQVTTPRPQRLIAQWKPVARRTLTDSRSLLIVDPTGECADLAAALVKAADRHGAQARVMSAVAQGLVDTRVDSVVILLPQTRDDVASATAALTSFYAERSWARALDELAPGGDCWLVTVGGVAVRESDSAPSLFHAGVSAGFASAGIEHPGRNFRHIDLAAGEDPLDQANKIVGALHTSGEAELALRGGKLFAKRLVVDTAVDDGALAPDHVLILGGTGKLGLRFAEHFARTGASRVTLVSRRGETPELASELAHLRRISSTEIVVLARDISDGLTIDKPVDLLLHAAVNYVDAELDSITAEDVQSAISSKIAGLENVLATVPLTDDARVLLFSSMAASIGGRGQILYAVTNRMLDVVAANLRARGIAAASLQWGLWNVAGPLDAAGFARVEEAGVYPMLPGDAIALGLATPARDGMIIAADWHFLREVLGAFGRSALLSELSIPETRSDEPLTEHAPARSVHGGVAHYDQSRHAGSDGAYAEGSRSTAGSTSGPRFSPAQRSNGLGSATGTGSDAHGAVGNDVPLDLQVRAELLHVIGGDDAESIDAATPLVALGLDSLQALDFRKRVKARLDRDLPVAAILGGASLDDVVALMTTNQG
ncbi:putative polyketide synthase MbtD [Nocardia camponoti]|uniref:Polyketide synthase MbtD n=2 Tax=Nocardia camponoti TaxID=1616106 RepID=A0A917QMZ6_9NOCA|nr:putative polyketide synthase MbtD [Nocardia camponoti]